MVIVAFVVSIVSLCILLKNNNFEDVNLKITEHLKQFNLAENMKIDPTELPQSREDGVKVINAKLEESLDEYEEPSSYYHSNNFISKDEYQFLTYEYGYDLQKIVIPTTSTGIAVESQVLLLSIDPLIRVISSDKPARNERRIRAA